MILLVLSSLLVKKLWSFWYESYVSNMFILDSWFCADKTTGMASTIKSVTVTISKHNSETELPIPPASLRASYSSSVFRASYSSSMFRAGEGIFVRSHVANVTNAK